MRDYGTEGQLGLEETPEKFVENMVEVFREVKRVLKKDGTVWMNLGDTYGKQVGKGFNTHEEDGTGNRVTEMQEKHGDIKVKTGLPDKSLVGIPWRVALALQADGWVLRSDIIWHKPNPMPESVKDRPTKSHEYIFLLTKSKKYYYDYEAIKEFSKIDGRAKNKRTVWSIPTQAYPEAHFATFPEEIPEVCIKAGTKLGDVVLDPFAGSGTTCAVASKLGRNSIGIELNEEYFKLARKRCKVDSESLYKYV
jgi:DNA modification methylase